MKRTKLKLRKILRNWTENVIEKSMKDKLKGTENGSGGPRFTLKG